MSEHEADRPAPDDPQEESAPGADFLHPDDPKEDGADFLFPDQGQGGDSDQGDDSDA